MKQFLLTCAFAAASVVGMAQTTDVSPVVGRYAGDLYISFDEGVYDEEARMDATVYLNQSATEGCVDFSLPNFNFSGALLGNIDLPNIGLTKNEDTYKFAKSDTVRFNFLDGAIIADATLDPATSYVKGDSLVAYVPVIWIVDEETTQPIYVLFKGKLANVYQLENGTFSESTWTQNKPWDSKHGYLNWDDIKTTSVSEEARQNYITPSPWCVSNVIGIDGSGATLVASAVDINATDEADVEADDYVANYAVALTNTPNPFMPTQTVPAYITLGTSWATAVSSYPSPKNADGGTFGGVAFTGKPDAVKFKYYHFNDNVSNKYAVINKDEPATVVAYLWKGQYKQEEVPGNTGGSDGIIKTTMYGRDRNILGMETAEGGATTTSDGAACIASVVKSITEKSTTATPLEMTVELDYGKYAGTDVTPDSLNLIFAANDYFGDRAKIGAGNTLIIDDVELVYYHAIKDVKQGDTPITFDADNNAVCTDIDYDATKFTYTKVGEGATVALVYSKENNTLYIEVSSQEVAFKPEEKTVYAIQFRGDITSVNKAAAAPAAEAAKAYTLDGRRAAKSAHGVVIVNGKKTVK